MKLTVESEDSVITKTMSDGSTWLDVLSNVFDMLRGIGYIITPFNEELLGAVEEVHCKAIELSDKYKQLQEKDAEQTDKPDEQ
jgi:hypothetical protein